MDSPLAHRYPALLALPSAGIATLPTPLEPAPALAETLGAASLAVKRDDLTNARYGGNKVRKLDLLLGDALARGARSVLTFGAYGSNHALATAVHARALGLEPHAVLSPQAPGPFAAATLRAHAALGTVLHPVDGWDGAREAISAKAALAARDGVEPYVIPMGGTAPLGTVGYVNAAFELAEQTEADVVYCAAGTLGTAVGLALGFAAAGVGTRVRAVRVTPLELANEEVAERLVEATVALLRGFDDTFPALTRADLALELTHDFFEPGYGVATPETLAAVELARTGAGVGLETTYTGRAFLALSTDAAAGLLGTSRVVFLDTYNSAPRLAAGPDEALPEVLRAYVAECDRLFPSA